MNGDESKRLTREETAAQLDGIFGTPATAKARKAAAEMRAAVLVGCYSIAEHYGIERSQLPDNLEAMITLVGATGQRDVQDKARAYFSRPDVRLGYRQLQDPVETKPADTSQRPEYVATGRVAAYLKCTSKTLLTWLNNDPEAPQPAVEGGGGKPHLWNWAELRPWLEAKTGRMLPEKFPGNPPS